MKKLQIALYAFLFLAAFESAAQDLPIDVSKYKPVRLPNPTQLNHDSLTSDELYLISKNKWSHSKDSLLVGESRNTEPTKQLVNPGYNPFEGQLNENEEVFPSASSSDTGYIFSNLQPADLLNGFPNYPFSAVVKLFIASEDDFGNVTYGDCSGAMIGPRHVITAGHCVVDPQKNTELKFGPNTVAVPAYNLGNSPYGHAQIVEWLAFNGWTNSGNWNYDVALLVLDRDIGNTVGWLGYGYNENDNWFLNSSNTHSSVGYPGSDDFGNPVFEAGKRMYAMQGYMDWFESFNAPCHNNIGFHGQSGSGLYYKDNNDRYVLGVLSHGNGRTPPYHTCHTRMNEQMFSVFRDKIRETTVSLSEEIANSGIKVYPNPADDVLHIQFSQTINEPMEMDVFNLQGVLLFSQKLQQGQHQFTHSTSHYAKGLYFIHLRSSSSIITFKILKE